jgi:non-ribosomal peptide synthetase component F
MNRKQLQDYVSSLPERLLRSVTGLAAGAARELGEVVLPFRVRRSRLYGTVVASTLRFLIEEVGQVEGAYPGEAASVSHDFLIRRAVGNVFEIAGIAAFHASPVWVLAALADLAGAGRDLHGEIVKALQNDGLLEQGRGFHNVDQLLDGLERTAARLADTVNTPPLDVATLRMEWAKVRADASRIPKAAFPDADRLSSLWTELKQEAALQQRSVLEVSSLIAVEAIRTLPDNARWLSRIIRTGGRRTGEVLAHGLLDHYQKTLAEIHETGYLRYWFREYQPYLRGAVLQFSLQRVSSTERFLSRRRVRNAANEGQD